MSNNNDFLSKMIGEKIQGITYVPNQYIHDLSGDWTNTDLNRMVLTMQEIGLQFKSGDNIFFSNSNLLGVSDESNFQKHEQILLPHAFDWVKLFGATIVNYKLWRFNQSYSKQSVFSKKMLSVEKSMIQVALNNSSQLFITMVKGDIGKDLFYPSGVYNNEIGIFINKLIVSRVDVNGFVFKLKDII